MNKALQLESSEAMPSEIRARLAAHRQLFLSNGSIEAVLEDHAMRQIAQDLEVFLGRQRIRAYHCTKEPEAGYFEAHGLRPTEVAHHQAWFLERFGHSFTPEQRCWLEAAWHDYFINEGQAKLRNGLIWACLTRRLVIEDGCESFFKYFGGEAISMVADADPEIAAILESIGRPVVVELAVEGSTLRAGYPMSLAVLSRHHRQLRPDARFFDSEGRWSVPVLPADIIKVTALDEFRL